MCLLWPRQALDLPCLPAAHLTRLCRTRALCRYAGDCHAACLPCCLPACLQLLFQVPCCAALAHAWARRRQGAWLPALVYAVHVLSTMPPILLELLADPRPTRTCVAVYSVWVALPILVLARCAAAGPAGARLFDEEAAAPRAKARKPASKAR